MHKPPSELNFPPSVHKSISKNSKGSDLPVIKEAVSVEKKEKREALFKKHMT